MLNNSTTLFTLAATVALRITIQPNIRTGNFRCSAILKLPLPHGHGIEMTPTTKFSFVKGWGITAPIHHAGAESGLFRGAGTLGSGMEGIGNESRESLNLWDWWNAVLCLQMRWQSAFGDTLSGLRNLLSSLGVDAAFGRPSVPMRKL